MNDEPLFTLPGSSGFVFEFGSEFRGSASGFPSARFELQPVKR
jgi:hypothetical protein